VLVLANMVDHGSPEGHGRSTNTSFVNSSLLGVAISLPIIATISVLLRLYARRLGRDAKLRADDWTIIITLVNCYKAKHIETDKTNSRQVLCWAHSTNTIIGGVIGGINTINMPPREYVNIALRVSSFQTVSIEYEILNLPDTLDLEFLLSNFAIHRQVVHLAILLPSILNQQLVPEVNFRHDNINNSVVAIIYTGKSTRERREQH